MKKVRTSGEAIREARIEEGLKQKDLANLIEVSISTIGMYETDQREPTQGIRDRICDIFDCDYNYLFGLSMDRRSC